MGATLEAGGKIGGYDNGNGKVDASRYATSYRHVTSYRRLNCISETHKNGHSSSHETNDGSAS